MKRTADHNDADLILKLYELRREPLMREARAWMMGFLPKTLAEVQAVLDPGHPKNAFHRQVTSYWEMAASFVNREILHPDLFLDNCGEGLWVYARYEPFLPQLRDSYNPAFLTQIEKTIQAHPPIQQKLGRIRESLKKR